MTFRPNPMLTVATLAALAILLSLGTWQVNRLNWKMDLIERVNERLNAAPQDIDSLLSQTSDASELEYTRVAASGEFDHRREVHLYRLNSRGAPGYNVVTLLRRDGKPDILVNRGFVPGKFKDPETRQEGQVRSRQDIVGLLRLPQDKPQFAPAHNLESNEWYYYDLAAMADYLAAENPVPFIVEADGTPVPGGRPEGGQTRVEFKNDHLGYAITWYGLALALLGVYAVYHVNTGRLSFR